MGSSCVSYVACASVACLVLTAVAQPAAAAEPERPRMVAQVPIPSPIVAIGFSPDGARVVTAGSGLEVWDLRTGLLLRRIREEDESLLRSAIVRPDGVHAIAAGEQIVRVLDLDTGQRLRALPPESVVFGPLSASPDGRWLAAGAGQRLHVYRAEPLERVRSIDVLELGTAMLHPPVAFFPGSTQLLTARPSALLVLDVASGKILRTVKLPDPKPGDYASVDAVAISPDGARALVSGHGRGLQLWDLEKGELVRALTADTELRHVLFVGNDRAAVSGLFGVRVLEVATGESLRELAPREGVTALALHPDGRTLFVGGTEGGLFRFDAVTGESRRVHEPALGFTDLDVSADGRWVLARGDRSALVFDLDALRLDARLEPPCGLSDAALSPDGKKVLVSCAGAEVRVFDRASGRVSRTIPLSRELGYRALFSPDRRHALVHKDFGANEATVVDLDKGAVERKVTMPSQIGVPLFTADGGLLLAPIGAGGWSRFSPSGELVHTEPPSSKAGRPLAVSADGKRLLTRSIGDLALWDLATDKLISTLPAKRASAAALSRDGRRVLTGTYPGPLELWDTEKKKLLATLPGHSGPVNAVAFLADGARAVSLGSDGTLRVFELEKKASAAFAASATDWAVYTEDGLFDGSPRAGDLVAAVVGRRAHRVDQLAVKLNRPDLILKRLGLGSPELLGHLERAHARRLEALGLTEEALAGRFDAAPTARLGVEVSGAEAKLTIDLTASDADLARYQVWIDGVPIHTGAGRPVSGKTAHVVEAVPLTPGRSLIEVAAEDTRGAQSLRDQQVVERKDAEPGELWYLGVGVSKHADTSLDLRYAAKDVLDLGATLARAGRFRKTHVTTLTDEQVTVAHLREVKKALEGAKATDTVVVLVAGHGTHTDDARADYYFVTHETDPAKLRETAAPFELIESLLLDLAPRKKLLLLDTCESGERDEAEARTTATLAGARGLTARETRGLKRTGARAFLFDRDRYVYNAIGRRSGAVVLSSARGTELSYELESMKNGAFTGELIAGLTRGADADGDGLVTTDELVRYLARAVAERTADLQHPTADRSNVDVRLTLPVIP